MNGRCGWRVSIVMANPLSSFNAGCADEARRAGAIGACNITRSKKAFQAKTFKTGKADMLTLQPISSEQKSVLQALVSLATRPEQTGRNVWSNSDGYPAWHLECGRAELAAACGVPTNDFEARKALDHAIEAFDSRQGALV